MPSGAEASVGFGAASRQPSASAGSGVPGACPSCGEPRADDQARFCEVCRYDFVTKKGGPPPAVMVPREAGKASPDPVPVPASSGAATWELVVAVDPSLDTDPDPQTPCPVGEADHAFEVDVAELLVGRRDDRRDIRPEIPVHDPGTSRRHAKFMKNSDGTVTLQDLASMNGTRLNGADMVAGSRQVLKEGDVVALGRWTTIRLRRKS
jgi:hypothetical protein